MEKPIRNHEPGLRTILVSPAWYFEPTLEKMIDPLDTPVRLVENMIRMSSSDVFNGYKKYPDYREASPLLEGRKKDKFESERLT